MTLSLEKKCQNDAIKMLYNNVVIGMLSSIFISFILVFMHYGDKEPQKLLWLVIMNIVLAFRLIDVFYFRKKLQQNLVNFESQRRRFLYLVIMSSGLWSFYFIFLCNHKNFVEVLMNFVAMIGLASGSLTVLAADKKILLFYLAILILPFPLHILFSDIKELQVLGLCGIVFSFVMLSLSNGLSIFTKNAIRLKNENALLVEDMELQVVERTKEIHQLSNIDPLTGLSNRNAFLVTLEQALTVCESNDTKLAVLFIDLDGFKAINDSLGHDLGDQVLKQTAERLASLKDEPLICRWGGDEFLIAITNRSESETLQYANHIISSINEPYYIEDNTLSLGATIGVSYYPEHAKSKMRLIELADSAMYFQKKLIPSRVNIFSEALNKTLLRDQHLKFRLAQAIDNNELRLVFQPIQQTDTRKIISFEALIRWNLDNQTVSPDELIGIAEQHGLIRKIGCWVLVKACKAAKKWNVNDRHISVSVNVSVIQFQDEDFIDLVQEALIESDLPANLLHIEITETVFNMNPELLFERVKILQSLGILVSIDDFGTGFSSLSLMQSLGVNMIKIDKTFIDNITTHGATIIEAVMNIADTLNYKVVAEGVETKEQADMLKSMGVHFLQGFYFAKPMELNNLVDYLMCEKVRYNSASDFSLTQTHNYD